MDRSMRQDDFERIERTRRTSVVGEFLAYLRETKKWWMLPILVVMLGLGVLALLADSPIAPFIYTLF
jgi:Family of unknown function (DUF5989)